MLIIFNWAVCRFKNLVINVFLYNLETNPLSDIFAVNSFSRLWLAISFFD